MKYYKVVDGVLAFFDSEVNGPQQNATLISDAQWAMLLAAQAEGKELVEVNGAPVARVPTKSDDTIRAQTKRAIRDEGATRIQALNNAYDDVDVVAAILASITPQARSADATVALAIIQRVKQEVSWAKTATRAELEAYDPSAGW